MKFDREQLDSFTCRDVFERFGMTHDRGRAPCPVCHTSEHSLALIFGTEKPHTYSCFACGAKGDAIRLYAIVGKVSPGRAMAEIASHLGLIESNPEDWDRRRRERLREAFFSKTAEEIAATRWRARLARLDRLRARVAETGARGCTPLGWEIMGGLYDQIGRLEAWIETREYPKNGWA